MDICLHRLLNKPYENEVTLTGKTPPLMCCQPLEILTNFKKDLDRLLKEYIKSVGQRAAKLPAIKV